MDDTTKITSSLGAGATGAANNMKRRRRYGDVHLSFRWSNGAGR